jgi:small subunit ribosomal protein S10
MAETAKTKAPADTQSRIRIKIRAYDHKLIDTATVTIIKTAERSGASVLGPVPLPTDRKRYTVNRSTFIDKTSRDQYEMRIHKRLIDIVNPTERTIDALMTLNLPAGVDVEIKM